MGQYPSKFYVLLLNMIKLHYTYEEMYEQVIVSFPELNLSYDRLLNIIEQLIIDLI